MDAIELAGGVSLVNCTEIILLQSIQMHGGRTFPKDCEGVSQACTIHAVGAEPQTIAISDLRSFLPGHIVHIASLIIS